jgi:hypothetical protein
MSNAQMQAAPRSCEAMPFVRKSAAFLARQFPHELAEQLESHLDQPFPVPCEFYVLDRIERLERAEAERGHGRCGVTADALVASAAHRTDRIAQRIVLVLALARRNYLVSLDQDGRWLLTTTGQRTLRAGKEARLAIWRTNIRLGVGQACAMVDLEDMADADKLVRQMGHKGAATLLASLSTEDARSAAPQQQPCAPDQRRARPARRSAPACAATWFSQLQGASCR